ncbi:hypothetical protein ACHAXT_004991 [Thalassiosira profunda]
MLLAALQLQPSDALLQPPSKALGCTRRRIPALRNALDDLYDDGWDEEASQAILDGQGNFFSLESARGGDSSKGNALTKTLSAISPNNALHTIKEGYRQRVAADPAFLSKSLLEIILAASTQYMAEVTRRGKDRMLPEIDFVFAGVLTAVCGKYYSMWRVARTIDADADDANRGDGEKKSDTSDTTTDWRANIPTNAFQPTLLDGRTKPTLSSRVLAFLLPMPQLFRAGVIASTIGYGLTSFLVRLKTFFVPQYVASTEPVSVPLAAIYTGLFMAFVSNVRYQLLQGVVEPYLIDGTFEKVEALHNKEGGGRIARQLRHLRHAKRAVVVLVRWANGLLGSWIAIGGMRAFGLQKLKE